MRNSCPAVARDLAPASGQDARSASAGASRVRPRGRIPAGHPGDQGDADAGLDLAQGSMSSATPRSTVAIRFASLGSRCLPRRYVEDASSSSLIRSSTITIISSGFLRACLTAATVGGGSRIRTWSACAPRRPSATPNSTRCPCRSAVVPVGSADECTNTSPPSSRARKPYPLSESYHLTLPVGTRRPHVEENENNQRSCDRQDALGTSKVIGPGRRNAASLWPGSGLRPGRPAGPFRSGLTRSDGAGTGSRARPESERDLPHDPRPHGAYTQHLYRE